MYKSKLEILQERKFPTLILQSRLHIAYYFKKMVTYAFLPYVFFGCLQVGDLF